MPEVRIQLTRAKYIDPRALRDCDVCYDESGVVCRKCIVNRRGKDSELVIEEVDDDEGEDC